MKGAIDNVSLNVNFDEESFSFSGKAKGMNIQDILAALNELIGGSRQ